MGLTDFLKGVGFKFQHHNKKSIIEITNINECETSEERKVFKLAQFMFDDYDIILTREEDVGFARINDDLNERKLYIGVNNIKNDTMDDVEMLVTLNHEKHHCYQFSTLFENDPNAKYSFLAKQDNKQWYKLNYPYLTYEVDATKHGIKGAYEELCKEYGEVNAEKYILQHIERHVAIGDSKYIGSKYSEAARLTNCKSIQDVFDRLDRRLEESTQISLGVRLTGNIYPFTDPEYIKKCDSIINSIPAGIEQSKCIAAYNIEQHPNLKKYCNEQELQELDTKRYDLIFDIYKKQRVSKYFLYRTAEDKEQRRRELCSKSLSELKEIADDEPDISHDERSL